MARDSFVHLHLRTDMNIQSINQQCASVEPVRPASVKQDAIKLKDIRRLWALPIASAAEFPLWGVLSAR
jgi:hypothetical protein